MRCTVFGTGYLGATHAACMAELGHDVLGVDTDAGKIAKLEAGEVPFFEPDLPHILRRNLEAGRLKFTTSYEEAVAFADIHFLTVGTPQKEGGHAADLSQIDAVVEGLAPLLTKSSVIVGKSTVPVGTATELATRIRRLAPAGHNVEVAWNPEFLREGFAVNDTLSPDRLVLGIERGRDGRSELLLREIYASLIVEGVPIVVTDLPTAELAKTSANAFLATKISFINAIAEVCEFSGANAVDISYILGLDPRIGRHFLNSGLGFGGGCLPKDIRAFMARAGELGATNAMQLLREVDNINMRRRTRMVELTRQMCGGAVLGMRIAVLGAAFKPGSDDVRDSPALHVAQQLEHYGAAVTIFDPQAMDNARRAFPTHEYATSALDACSGADAVLVLTEWAEFQALNPSGIGQVVSKRRILDGRNCLDRTQWELAGWEYRKLGQA